MRAATLWQSGGVAPFAESFAEMIRAVWLASRGDEKCQVLARRRVEHRLPVRMHRDRRQLGAGFLLFHCERAIADVLAAHADHVGAPLRGVEQEREREARLRADRMMRLELRDLFFGPCVKSVALDGCELDVCRWIVSPVAARARKLAERAQGREPTARRMRRLGVE